MIAPFGLLLVMPAARPVPGSHPVCGGAVTGFFE